MTTKPDETENTETFAKLRELLISAEGESKKYQDQSWMYELRKLLLDNYRARPDVHQQLWIPYCRQHLQQVEAPLWTVTTLEHLVEWHEAAPFVKFRMEFNSRNGGDWILQQIAASPATQMLVEIQAMDNEIMDKGLVALAKSPYTSQLRILHLGTNHIGSEGVEALVHSETIHHLEILDLNENEVGDQQLISIANSIHMKNLRILDLSHNNISDRGLEELANASNLDSLERIVLRGNREVSPRGYERILLSKALPVKARRYHLGEISVGRLVELANQFGLEIGSGGSKEEIIELIWQNQ